MARYDSKAQIIPLFLGAACVGLLLIVLLTAEAHKRQAALDRSDENVVTETEDMSELTGIKYIWSKVKSSVRYLTRSVQGQDSEGKTRRKREASPDYYSSHVIEGEYDDLDIETTSEQQPAVTEKPSTSKSHPSVSLELGSSLLGTALSGHKIRHIEEKISQLGADSQLVRAVLRMYCNKDETVLYVMCMEEGSDKNSTEKTSPNMTDHDDDDDDDMNTTGLVTVNKTTNHTKNYTESVHSYVNVMRNRLAPQVLTSAHSSGICSSFTEFIVVVILTTFANFFIFVLISLYCRLSKKSIAGQFTEGTKHLIAEEDDLENIDEVEAIRQVKGKRKSGNLHVNLCHQIGLNEDLNKI